MPGAAEARAARGNVGSAHLGGAVAAALDWSGQSRDAVAGIKTDLYHPTLSLLD
jgi:hypothetical protein